MFFFEIHSQKYSRAYENILLHWVFYSIYPVNTSEYYSTCWISPNLFKNFKSALYWLKTDYFFTSFKMLFLVTVWVMDDMMKSTVNERNSNSSSKCSLLLPWVSPQNYWKYLTVIEMRKVLRLLPFFDICCSDEDILKFLFFTYKWSVYLNSVRLICLFNIYL